MFLPNAEPINLGKSKSAFSIGLECEDYIEIHAQDIFTVEAKSKDKLLFSEKKTKIQ